MKNTKKCNPNKVDETFVIPKKRATRVATVWETRVWDETLDSVDFALVPDETSFGTSSKRLVTTCISTYGGGGWGGGGGDRGAIGGRGGLPGRGGGDGGGDGGGAGGGAGGGGGGEKSSDVGGTPMDTAYCHTTMSAHAPTAKRHARRRRRGVDGGLRTPRRAVFPKEMSPSIRNTTNARYTRDTKLPQITAANTDVTYIKPGIALAKTPSRYAGADAHKIETCAKLVMFLRRLDFGFSRFSGFSPCVDSPSPSLSALSHSDSQSSSAGGGWLPSENNRRTASVRASAGVHGGQKR